MKDSEIVKLALIKEAETKPIGDDKPYLVIGWETFTKKQFIEMVKNGDKRIEAHLKTALKLFKSEEGYRLKFMELAGVEK